MGRPLRLFEPDGIYFITGRCLQARMLLRPSNESNAAIGGILCEAMQRFDIDIFAFVFASNHFHMLLRSKTGDIPPFMQYLRSNIAKVVGRLVNWQGKFWDRRYDAEPVLDDDASVERMEYILAHGVKEGLVAKCQDWPGLSSTLELSSNAQRLFSWPKRNKATSNTPHSIKLTVLPCWQNIKPEICQQKVRMIIEQLENRILIERGNKQCFGVGNILQQDPHSRPLNIKRLPRPVCHTTKLELKKEYIAKYREFATAYEIASEAFRSGEFAVEFPKYAYRPPWVVPRFLKIG